MDTCQEVGPVHLHKHWPLASADRLSVNVTHAKWIANVCLFTKSTLVAVPPLIYTWQGNKWSVWTIPFGKLRGNKHEPWEREHNDKSTRGKCMEVRIFAKHTSRGNATTVIHLAPCTYNVNYWRVCQIRELHNSEFCHMISVQRVSFIWPSQYGVIISFAALRDSCLWQWVMRGKLRVYIPLSWRYESSGTLYRVDWQI